MVVVVTWFGMLLFNRARKVGQMMRTTSLNIQPEKEWNCLDQIISYVEKSQPKSRVEIQLRIFDKS